MLDRDLVTKAIRTSTEEVFAMMLEMQPQCCGANDQAPNTSGDRLIAMIGLAGPWSGTGTLTCSPALAAEVSSKMFMTEAPAGETVITNEVLDAVAELTNMIIGNVKTAIEEALGSMAMTIPTVVYGRNFTIRNIGGVQETCVSFKLEQHEFEVHLGLAPSTARQAPAAGRVSSLTMTPE